jgi:hypothetical protein
MRDKLTSMVRLLPPGSLSAAAVLALGLTAGCGFRSPPAVPEDGQPADATDADSGTDTPIDTPVVVDCMPRWRAGNVTIGTPVRLTDLGSTTVDRNPFVTANELAIYFSSDRSAATGDDVYVSTRGSLTEAFGAPQRANDISSADADSRFSMTSNELIGVVASDRTGTIGSSDVWLATRMNKQAPFLAFLAANVAAINTGEDELDPELSADGLHMYLAIGSNQEIAMATRAATDVAFSAPQALTVLNSSADDADPSVSADELVIVFSSERTQGGGDAMGDLYYSKRAMKTDAFDNPRRVPTVNMDDIADRDPALSPDGCRLYFASTRDGNYELYVAPVMP